jgi:hypothetical protein
MIQHYKIIVVDVVSPALLMRFATVRGGLKILPLVSASLIKVRGIKNEN